MEITTKVKQVLADLPEDKIWDALFTHVESTNQSLTVQVDKAKYNQMETDKIFVPLNARENIEKLSKEELVEFLDAIPVNRYLAAKRLLKELKGE